MSTNLKPGRLDSSKDFSAFVPSAFQAANLAFLQANAAFTVANTGSGAASAGEYANAAFIQANSAFTRANNSLNITTGGTVAGDVIITGNLTIQGERTYANTQTVLIADNIITVNAAIDQASAPVFNAGIEVDRGSSANTDLLWNESTDKWTATNDGTNYFNLASDSAESYANSAYTQANTATTNAAAADSKAVTAGSYANSAYTQANTGVTDAATADSKAVVAGSYANSAFLHANAAFTAANSASGGGGVTSFSAGVLGFTPSTATTGAIVLTGILAVANGGTGVTTSTGSGAVVLGTSPTISGSTINGGYTEQVFAVSGATPALAVSDGSIQTWTLPSNCTPTSSLTTGQSITLMITADSYTITWPSVTWKTGSGVAPTLNTGAGVTAIQLWNVGGVLYGARVGNN